MVLCSWWFLLFTPVNFIASRYIHHSSSQYTSLHQNTKEFVHMYSTIPLIYWFYTEAFLKVEYQMFYFHSDVIWLLCYSTHVSNSCYENSMSLCCLCTFHFYLFSSASLLAFSSLFSSRFSLLQKKNNYMIFKEFSKFLSWWTENNSAHSPQSHSFFLFGCLFDVFLVWLLVWC